MATTAQSAATLITNINGVSLSSQQQTQAAQYASQLQSGAISQQSYNTAMNSIVNPIGATSSISSSTPVTNQVAPVYNYQVGTSQQSLDAAKYAAQLTAIQSGTVQPMTSPVVATAVSQQTSSYNYQPGTSQQALDAAKYSKILATTQPTVNTITMADSVKALTGTQQITITPSMTTQEKSQAYLINEGYATVDKTGVVTVSAINTKGDTLGSTNIVKAAFPEFSTTQLKTLSDTAAAVNLQKTQTANDSYYAKIISPYAVKDSKGNITGYDLQAAKDGGVLRSELNTIFGKEKVNDALQQIMPPGYIGPLNKDQIRYEDLSSDKKNTYDRETVTANHKNISTYLNEGGDWQGLKDAGFSNSQIKLYLAGYKSELNNKNIDYNPLTQEKISAASKSSQGYLALTSDPKELQNWMTNSAGGKQLIATRIQPDYKSYTPNVSSKLISNFDNWTKQQGSNYQDTMSKINQQPIIISLPAGMVYGLTHPVGVSRNVVETAANKSNGTTGSFISNLATETGYTVIPGSRTFSQSVAYIPGANKLGANTTIFGQGGEGIKGVVGDVVGSVLVYGGIGSGLKGMNSNAFEPVVTSKMMADNPYAYSGKYVPIETATKPTSGIESGKYTFGNFNYDNFGSKIGMNAGNEYLTYSVKPVNLIDSGITTGKNVWVNTTAPIPQANSILPSFIQNAKISYPGGEGLTFEQGVKYSNLEFMGQTQTPAGTYRVLGNLDLGKGGMQSSLTENPFTAQGIIGANRYGGISADTTLAAIRDTGYQFSSNPWSFKGLTPIFSGYTLNINSSNLAIPTKVEMPATVNIKMQNPVNTTSSVISNTSTAVLNTSNIPNIIGIKNSIQNQITGKYDIQTNVNKNKQNINTETAIKQPQTVNQQQSIQQTQTQNVKQDTNINQTQTQTIQNVQNVNVNTPYQNPYVNTKIIQQENIPPKPPENPTVPIIPPILPKGGGSGLPSMSSGGFSQGKAKEFYTKQLRKVPNLVLYMPKASMNTLLDSDNGTTQIAQRSQTVISKGGERGAGVKQGNMSTSNRIGSYLSNYRSKRTMGVKL